MVDSPLYRQAKESALQGRLDEAVALYQRLLQQTDPGESSLSALIHNDLGAIAATMGQPQEATGHFHRALAIRADWQVPITNLRQLTGSSQANLPANPVSGSPRIALVSLLFNWPSTGGGTIHTKELAEQLTRAGYTVRHFFSQQEEWRMGTIGEPLPYGSEPLPFSLEEWNGPTIRNRFRQAVSAFAPDFVIVTDSWNTKPLLAEAVSEFPYFLRIAAMECLCPLNNVRLLVDDNGTPRQCSLTQLANPESCRLCLSEHHRLASDLHRCERLLGGVEEENYPDRLRRAFANARSILAVNPTIAELVAPFAPSVEVLPSGFDRRRFPVAIGPRVRSPGTRLRILFAGLTQEYMKGFHVLERAGEILAAHRDDFEIVVTADPVERAPKWMRFVGWQSQSALPTLIEDCDIVVFPTVAQEALGRVAVEAMGCGRPVVASRIGGLPWVLDEGNAGLLCQHGEPQDLAEKIETLLDNPKLRRELGAKGRERFEEHFTWEAILPRYDRLFSRATEDPQPNSSHFLVTTP